MQNTVEWNGYLVERKWIGKGSYAKVYKGFNKQTNQPVAIKKISFKDLPENVKSRTMVEVQILETLNHPNIIKLYGHKFDNDYLFLITEYCNGGELTKWIKNNNNPDETLQVIKQIMEGMNYLHQNNIIHRDIKPQNILLSDSTVKICDFGFSKEIKDELNMMKTICGTPIYMSPEVINMKPYTIKSEIWSLGIIFYMIFFKEHPYGHLKSIYEYKTRLGLKPNLKEVNLFDNVKLNDLFNDLILEMLNVDEKYRPSSITILNRINNLFKQEEPDDLFFLGDSKMLLNDEEDITDYQSTELLTDKFAEPTKYNKLLNFINNSPVLKSPSQISLRVPNDSSSFINSPITPEFSKFKLGNRNIDTFSPNKTIIIDNYFDIVDEIPMGTSSDKKNSVINTPLQQSPQTFGSGFMSKLYNTVSWFGSK